MRNITDKYYIQFVGCEVLESPMIKLSKREYINNMMRYVNQMDNPDNTDEFAIRYREELQEYPNHTTAITIFTVGTSDIYLYHFKCKEGYKFK